MPDSNDGSQNDRLEVLLDQYFDGMIDEDGCQELEHFLVSDEANKQRYLAKAAITGGLINWAIEDNSKQVNRELLRQLVDKNQSRKNRVLGIETDLPVGVGVSVSIGLLVCVFLSIYFGTDLFKSNLIPRLTQNPIVDRQNNDSDLAEGGGNSSDTTPKADESHSLFVARISTVSDDVQWGAKPPVEFLMRLKRNELVSITGGKALVEFASGAQLALLGPTTIEILDADAANLLSGRVRGFADGGNFRLATPTADVIDLGTEFGVLVDDSSQVQVTLFRGSVDVRPEINNDNPERIVRLDVEGTGATIASDGTVQLTKMDDAAKFEWTIEPRNDATVAAGTISLVDIVAGGDGLQNRIAGAINPITGEIDRRPTPRRSSQRYRQDSHSGEFKRNFSSSFIDGAFITRRRSYSFVNSNGDTFDFGRNQARTLGPIWSRSNVVHRIQAGSKDDFWGARTLPPIIEALEKSKLGLLGIHPNAGITFDLTAIRKHHERTLDKFSGILKNLDNSMEVVSVSSSVSTANFRVLVDGKPRFEKLAFRKAEGEISVDVDIRESDRFLTLVSTDAGDSMNFDRVVVVDPVLLSK